MTISALIPVGLGFESGRIEPTLTSPPEGDWVLSLAAETETRTATLVLGNRISWSQDIDRDVSNGLSAKGFVRGPLRMPAISADPGPFALAGGQTIEVTSDRETRVITLDPDDFVSIGAATAIELATVLSRDLDSEFSVEATIGGGVIIVSTQSARQAIISVGGTAPLSWQYPVWCAFLAVDGVRLYERVVHAGSLWNLSDVLVRLDDWPGDAGYELGLELIERNGLVPTLSEPLDYFLPAIYFDDLIFLELAPTKGVIADRVPESGEPGLVPGPYRFDFLADPLPSPLPDVYVSIDGAPEELVLSAGVVQAPWDGPLSGTSSISSTQERLVLDPTFELPSEAVLTVRIDGGGFSPEVFDLNVEDTLGPEMIEVTPLAKNSIRVTFNEPVDDTALEPGRYTLDPVDLPAVIPAISSVTRDAPDQVTLTLDDLASVGRRYNLVVSSVDDLNGNDSGELVDGFVSWIPPETPSDRRFPLITFLPEFNRIDLDGIGDLNRFVACLQEVTDTILCQIDRFVEFVDPDRAPSAVLDLMLYDLGNPFAFELSVIDKRKLVKLLVEIYRGKGTEPGIVDAVRFFTGIEITIDVLNDDPDGWVLGESEMGETTILGSSDTALLYTFDVISPVTLTDEQRDRICTIVEYMKPAHTHKRNLVEPVDIGVYDPLEVGLSELGFDWILH